MLNEFNKCLEVDKKFETDDLYEGFCKEYSATVFGGGLFNSFDVEKRDYWNAVVETFYPQYKDKISVIGYDWLGRIFATLKDKDCVKLFEIGTGETLNIGCTLEKFLDEEIPVYSNDCLAHKFFNEWKKENPEALPYGKCVGYRIPLFLGGKDNVSNLEISDMDVYWTVTGTLLGRKKVEDK